MQDLKVIFVLLMLLLVVFPLLYSPVPMEQRTPFEVKIEIISVLSDGFVAFPEFPSPPSFSNPIAALRYLSSIFFVFGNYLVSIIVFFTHNIRVVTQMLGVLVMP